MAQKGADIPLVCSLAFSFQLPAVGLGSSSKSLAGWPAASPSILGEGELETTYAQLIEEHKRRLHENPVKTVEQVIRNHLSVMNGYLTFCGKTPAHRIGREFTLDFIKQSKTFVVLTVAGNRQSAADKLSILRSWHKTLNYLTATRRLADVGGTTLFHKALRVAIASKGESLDEIARAIAATPRTLPTWMNGGMPIKKEIPTVRRLEAYLGLERDDLVSKLEYPGKTVDAGCLAPADSYVERLKAYVKVPFYLTEKDISPSLEAEWFDLMSYKTAVHPQSMRRSPHGVWRVLPDSQATGEYRKDRFCHPAEGEVCVTAAKIFLTVRSYLGFLAKDRTNMTGTSGLELPLAHIQTIAVFLIPEFLNAYFEFMKARAGNIVHTGHSTVAGAIRCLAREETGYLRQRPEMYQRIERFAKGRSWDELCDETCSLCDSWKQLSKGKKSRDPKAPISDLMSLDDPLEPLKQAIRKLDMAAAACAPGSAIQACQKRNALLLAMMISNPLRARTMTIAKYVAKGSSSLLPTNLYQTQKGEWRLRFYKGDFKNDGSKQDDYDAPLPSALSARIEEYLDIYRPILVCRDPTCPWLFPTQVARQLGGVGELIARIARSYIPEVSRLGAHALRHIVATDFLRKNPGQYVVIAELLHDRLETVLKHYTHEKLESAFKAHETHLKGFFSGI